MEPSVGTSEVHGAELDETLLKDLRTRTLTEKGLWYQLGQKTKNLKSNK